MTQTGATGLKVSKNRNGYLQSHIWAMHTENGKLWHQGRSLIFPLLWLLLRICSNKPGSLWNNKYGNISFCIPLVQNSSCTEAWDLVGSTLWLNLELLSCKETFELFLHFPRTLLFLILLCESCGFRMMLNVTVDLFSKRMCRLWFVRAGAFVNGSFQCPRFMKLA